MSNNNHNGQHNQQNGPKLSEKEQASIDYAKKFAKTSLKKYCKKLRKEYGYSKKDALHAYYDDVFNYTLEHVCYYLLRWGHQPQNRQVVEGIYEKISDPKFVSELGKRVARENKAGDSGSDEFFHGIRFMPAVLTNLIREIKNQNKKLAENNEPLLSTEDLEVLRDLINQKKAKKLIKKSGCDPRLAYSVFAVYPVQEIAMFSPAFYMNKLMAVIYRAADEEGVKVPVDDIFKKVVGKEYYPNLILYLLLERKTVTQNFTNNQFAVYNRISEWVLKNLNRMDKRDIKKILQTYVNRRFEDVKRNKDANRRMYLRSSVSQAVYPTLYEVIQELMEAYNDKVQRTENYNGPDLSKIL